MGYEEFYIGQTVYITGGPHKGQKGEVYYVHNNYINVKFSESASIQRGWVSSIKPNTVPLPPAFAASFVKGDTVKHIREASKYYGKIGTIVQVGFMDVVVQYDGVVAKQVVEASSLTKVTRPTRVEGEEIAFKDLRVGDEVTATYKPFVSGGVSSIATRTGVIGTIGLWSAQSAQGRDIIVDKSTCTIVLDKAADADPVLTKLKADEAGTVISWTNPNDSTREYTAMKQANSNWGLLSVAGSSFPITTEKLRSKVGTAAITVLKEGK